jgi:2-polyprenyl-6-methoxyphenol hydroxylase-like FAD-dependent oxidoreductase
LVFGRVVLTGDAAFVARPHAGAGTTKAALDAACLADSIRDAGDDLDSGLLRYERMQQPFGRALVEVNQQEGAYLSAQIKPKAERTAAELHRDIGAVLHAHIARSDQVGDIVSAHGLDGHF